MQRYYIRLVKGGEGSPTHLQLAVLWKRSGGGFWGQITPVVRDGREATRAGKPLRFPLVKTTQRCIGAAVDTMDMMIRQIEGGRGPAHDALQQILQEEQLQREKGIWT